MPGDVGEANPREVGQGFWMLRGGGGGADAIGDWQVGSVNKRTFAVAVWAALLAWHGPARRRVPSVGALRHRVGPGGRRGVCCGHNAHDAAQLRLRVVVCVVVAGCRRCRISAELAQSVGSFFIRLHGARTLNSFSVVCTGSGVAQASAGAIGMCDGGLAAQHGACAHTQAGHAGKAAAAAAAIVFGHRLPVRPLCLSTPLHTSSRVDTTNYNYTSFPPVAT